MRGNGKIAKFQMRKMAKCAEVAQIDKKNMIYITSLLFIICVTLVFTNHRKLRLRDGKLVNIHTVYSLFGLFKIVKTAS